MAETKTKEAPTTEGPKLETPKPLLVSGGGVQAIVPQDFEQVWRMAQVIKAAGMAPKALDSVEKITIAIIQGMEVGLKPMQSVQSIAVINNMPSIYGDAMLALVISSPVYGEHEEWQELDDKTGDCLRAVCRARRKGEEKWTEQIITRPQAARAGWLKKAGPWQESPQRMFQMRARGWCLRDAFPDVLRGMVSAEEAADMIDITPAGGASTAPPRPKRQDYTEAMPAHDEATGEMKEEPKEPEGNPWLAVGKNQEELADSMLALIDRLKSLADIESFETANKENIEKATTQIQRRVTLELKDIRESLGGA